jgi:hypothetical protein
MKITLQAAQFVFTPSTNTVSFATMLGAFKPECLLAVINTTTGKLVYSAASQPAGFGGTFSTNIYPNDTLTYLSSNAGQSASDILQVLYDDQTFTQPVTGIIAAYTHDGNGNVIGSVQDPVSGDYKLLTGSNTYAADGTPILSTVDPMTGGDGLNMHLQSSSYGGQVGNPIPVPNNNNALSVGFLNNSVLVSPAMDPVTNELLVKTSGSVGTQDVNVTQVAGTAISVGQAVTDTGTIRVASNGYSSNGDTLDYGNGQITSLGSQRMSLGDYAFSGPSGVITVGRNIITDTASSNDLNGYRYFSIQIVCTATAGTFIFETSNDDINWQPLAVSNQSLTTGVIITSAITATPSSFIYVGTMTGRYIRIRVVTTLTGGSAQAVCRFSQVAPLANNVTISSGSASTVAPNIDVLGSAVSGSRYNQLEIDFNTVPNASLLTTTVAGGGTITASNGHTLFATSTPATSSARGVSVGVVQYRAANEMYGYFSAAFTISGARQANSFQRIGIYDTNNGFFIGWNGLNFGVTKRTGGVDTFVNRTAWNGDLLDGSPSSKFTRNNIPEAINLTVSNLFRIRFAWLGSASILFDVFSPDGIWVNYHTIKQPNIDFNPSLTVPNLPMTVDCAKAGTGTEILTIATACWAGGTSSSYSPITATLTDQSLASLNRSVITGVTTGGGGGYVNVKVNPSGALVTESTISGTVTLTSPTPVTTENYIAGQLANNATPASTVAGSGTNLLNAAGGATSIDATGYRTVTVQIICNSSAAVINFEHSNDNINYQNFSVYRLDASTTALTNVYGNITPGTGTGFVYTFPVMARYVRLRLNTAPGVGQTVQCFTRFSAMTWHPPQLAVMNTTAANLNATISGTATVSQATAANLNCTAAVSGATLASSAVGDMVSVSTVASGNSGATGISVLNSHAQSFQVTNVITTGTGSIDAVIQESYDAGANWVDIYHLDRVTGAGTVRQQIPSLKVNGDRVRYAWTVTGTLTTATMSVTRIPRQVTSGNLRRIYNRTLDPNTLNSSTPALFTEGCEYTDLIVNMAAGGTAPVIQLQGSEDNTNWYNIGAALTATVGSTTAVSVADGSLPKFSRATVTTAGAGSTLNYVAIKAKGAS